MQRSDISAIAIAIGSLLFVIGFVCNINNTLRKTDDKVSISKVGLYSLVLAFFAFAVGIVLKNDKAFEMIKAWLK